ncbi:head-tail connector protein [Bosea sp. (in: a-proteobacteria)]|uniref:head-tail connector protein n=1 Tax=Bosea sp. (in: a-proteobacteria) TaxID=1871050 RepID=UPI002FC7BD99
MTRATMTPLAISPPAIEPVSLAEAKDFLRLLANDEDELLGTLVTAARLMVEAASGRMLINQSWRLVLDRWPAGGEIRLPFSPVGSIAAARVYDAGGSSQVVPLSSLALVAGTDPPLITVSGPVPAPGRERAAIEIDVVAGFGATRDTVPAPLRQAVLRLACRWFEHRGDVVSRDATQLPAEIAVLVAPFRRLKL